MSSSDADRVAGRTSPYSSRNGMASPPQPSTSLSHVHIADALKQSPDNGATLDLTHRKLTDVGESGAEELATIGREDIMEDESSVLRYNAPQTRSELLSDISSGDPGLLWVIIGLQPSLWRSPFCRVLDT